MSDIRWFAPNRLTRLVLPELRARGLEIETDGDQPARIAFAASGTVAREAWRYCRRFDIPLVLYVWDLPPWRLGDGRSDRVLDFGGRLIRLPRLVGGFRERRGFYSELHHIARKAAEVWVPSRESEADVLAHFGLECRHMPYCFDDKLFTPGDASRDGGFLLTVSRLIPHKNQELAIRAAGLLDMPLRIIGRGPREESLRVLAERSNVRCTVETDVSDDALLAVYREAAAIICPSRFEGFGLTGVEAASCATRVVASDIPTHREFLDGVATFFPLDDPTATAAAVRTALDGPRPDPERVHWLSTQAAATRFAAGFARLLGASPRRGSA